MPLVRILKATGFEQVGDIVDYQGNVEEAFARGVIELLDADPRPVVNSQTVEEPVQEPVVEPIVEQPVQEPVVEPAVEETPVVAPIEEQAPVEEPVEPVVEGQ